jgi:AraC-like DNA-binding protein
VTAAEESRRELEGGWTRVRSRPPHPALAGHVLRYWAFAERYPAPVRRRELPSPEVVVMVSFGPELRLLDARDQSGTARPHWSFVAGLTEASIVTEMDGVSDALQLNLTPLGAYCLLGLPMDELANRIVSFDDVLGPAGPELRERLACAPSSARRFELLDDYFCERLAEAPSPAPGVLAAWHAMRESEGRARVGSLARDLGWSRRRLAARFREQVGLTPKAAARVLRFSRAIRLVEGHPRPSWAELALDCGYYDQAHFNRDFRQFAGSTPTEYLARRHGDDLAPE